MPLKSNVVEIKYASELHKKVIKAFDERLQMAKQVQSKRTKNWADNEDIYQAYIPEKEADADRRIKRESSGESSFRTIALPYSYATLLSAHTYYTSVFLARSPVIQVSGRHGESQQSEMAIEALLDYQITTGGNLVPLYCWLLEPGKYGIGWLGHHWDKEEVTVVNYRDEPETKFGFKTGRINRVPVESTVIGYNGNRCFNLRPQDAFPDHRLPANKFQEGEYFIRYTELGMHRVKQRASQGYYYNIATAARQSAGKLDRDTGSPRTQLPNEDIGDFDYRKDEKEPLYLKLHEFYWDVVPSEYGLSKSNKLQKWVFTIANEKVIIGAQPLGLASNKYPFDILEHEIDAYSVFKRGLLEVMDPLNKTMEWLFNTHFYNVRAALNNQLVVDPSRIVMKDFENPEPGRLLRLKPIAYGTDARQAVSQLAVGDVTGGHLRDAGIVSEMLQRVSGVNDQIMGMMEGGRKTATEVRSSTTFGVNRMKTNCEYFSAMGFAPLTQKLIQSTQQLYDMERKFKMVGNLAQWSQKYMQVTPEQIAGFYDFVPVDGTLPVDRFAQANLWQQILQGLNAMPMVGQSYDIPKIFAYVAQLAGLKNIDQFRIQTMPNDVLQNEIQKGNMVPIAEGNPNEPGQVPNVGATG